MRKLLYAALALVLSLAVPTVGLAKGYQAEVRVVHASPDAPSVDVLVNDAIPAFTDVMFGEATGYAPLRAGQYNFKVVPMGGGPGDAVIDADLSLFPNTDYTVVAVNTLSSIEPLVLVDENNPVSVRKSRVRFVHASPDAPAVDIRVVGGPYLFEDVPFKGVGDYVTVRAGSYDVEVVLADTDTVVLSLPGVMLEGGTTYTVFAIGFAAGTPSLGVLVTVDNENSAKSKAAPRP